jgi:hypothetical protein
MDSENELLPMPDREKWGNIHRIFYQGQSWLALFNEFQEGV